jgi:uncharacterized YigZ family protein
MFPDTYQTIEIPSEGLFKEKGSKFLAYAYPVNDEQDIKTILGNIRKEHFSARHCCYAWRLGLQNERFRINDDGEPSGTAGRPIFGQIQSYKLTNILLVVVRYFGGTLLGVSGLIQAYKKAAGEAISNANIVTRIVEHILEVHFEYIAMNDLMLLVKEEQLEVVHTKFDLNCLIQLKVRSAKMDDISSRIGKINGIITREFI